MTWKFVEHTGIYSVDNAQLELFFGTKRDVLRKLLHYDAAKNEGRFANEDSYEQLLGNEEDWIRLGFNDYNELESVEVLDGIVIIGKTEVEIFADMEETLAELDEQGFDFEETELGYTDFRSHIDLGDSALNGDEVSEVCWFYTAVNFDHLLPSEE
ncbi:MAG: hypothetical protein K1X56_06365 [Flavobacteriales bacterium]|nr:hypothetical protein [Flavobacteriales bacterium]